MSFQNLYQNLKNKKPVRTVLWRGENPYFEKVLKELLRKECLAEVKSFQVPKAGLEPEMVEASQGGFLFSPFIALFLKFSGSIASWKTDAQKHLKEALERADGQQLLIFLMVPSDKRLKWDGLGCDVDLQVEDVSDAERAQWVNHMNQTTGGNLDQKKMHFVLSQEGDLLQLEKFVEMWNLGGDLWAEKQLGWGVASAKSQTADVVGGAFDWVDYVFQRNHRKATVLVQELIESGEDPIKLLGLISKSARILALIDMGKDLSSQPPFLVQKLKKYKGQSSSLLRLCREADVSLKSTSVNGKALMQRLGCV